MKFCQTKFILGVVALLLIGVNLFALGPHELLVLANGREPDSVEIAKTYMRLRKIPEVNLVMLNIPRPKSGSYLAISPEGFTRHIWSPVIETMRTRGIDDHILAWAYSTQMPIRTQSRPVVSIQGLTFLRNHMPEPQEAGNALYVSPLFAGPDSPDANGYGPKSFDSSKQFLREDMPLPNMTLGYIGERGNSKAEVLNCLKTGLWSDGTHPDGTVYYLTNSNIRSRCRQWQFKSAAHGLRLAGIKSTVSGSFPKSKRDVMGIMMGSAQVDSSQVGKFIPGAMAEHLTSFAAVFDSGMQTKLSSWISAGATASAGTVCEPMSNWRKFPSARFFNHYAYGCTVIESFYQSIRCPLQIMLVGDPLAAPWAPPPSIKLNITGVQNGEMVIKPININLHLRTIPRMRFSKFIYLVDGRVKGSGDEFVLDPTGLEPGEHELRAVAYRAGFVRSQIFDIKTFRTK